MTDLNTFRQYPIYTEILAGQEELLTSVVVSYLRKRVEGRVSANRASVLLLWVYSYNTSGWTVMSESPNKPAFRVKTHVDIQTGAYGLFRFKTWTLKDGRAISKLCNDDLLPRVFAEKLLAYLVTEPILKAEDLECWPDRVLEEVCAEWWKNVRPEKLSLTEVSSLDKFQSVVCKHNLIFSETANSTARTIDNLRRSFEHNALSLTQALGNQRPFLIPREPEMSEAVKRMLDVVRENPLASLAKRHVSFSSEMFGLEALRERQGVLALSGVTKQFDALDLKGLTSPWDDRLRGFNKFLENFREFEKTDTARLAKVLESLNSVHKTFLPSFSGLEAAAAAINTSWIDRLKPEISVASLIGLSALTSAANAKSPFDISSVTAIRGALGDWQGVKMPWRFLPDSKRGEQFYVDRGFDTNLVQLPEPAFTQALNHVGLVRPSKSVEVPGPLVDEEQIILQRVTGVFILLFRFERKLRDYIDRVMSEKYGNDWEKARCHGNGAIYRG